MERVANTRGPLGDLLKGALQQTQQEGGGGPKTMPQKESLSMGTYLYGLVLPSQLVQRRLRVVQLPPQLHCRRPGTLQLGLGLQ